jgi:hypothetical protein
MCIKFYEIGKSKKGILRRALKMWYMFADYNNTEKKENQICPLVKPQRISELHKEQRFSCTAQTLQTLQVGVRALFFFRKKVNLYK